MLNLLTMLTMTIGLRAEGIDHPCEAVKAACEAAGFVQGKAKDGVGLWKDCIEPLMAGKPAPAKSKKPLPKVDAAVIAACNAKHGITADGKK